MNRIKLNEPYPTMDMVVETNLRLISVAEFDTKRDFYRNIDSSLPTGYIIMPMDRDYTKLSVIGKASIDDGLRDIVSLTEDEKRVAVATGFVVNEQILFDLRQE